MKKCGFENCDNGIKARGICNKHYQQLRIRNKLTIAGVYWTDSQKEQAVRLREQGQTYRIIGEMLGRSTKAIKDKMNGMLNSGEYFDLLDGRKAN